MFRELPRVRRLAVHVALTVGLVLWAARAPGARGPARAPLASPLWAMPVAEFRSEAVTAAAAPDEELAGIADPPATEASALRGITRRVNCLGINVTDPNGAGS